MAKYIIFSECNGKREVFFESTTKREIEAKFNRYMKLFAKDTNYLVEQIRLGYARVTYFGTFSTIETEYWIARA